MTTQTKALTLALDLATMHHTDDGYAELRSKVRQLAKEALAQPEQEPVAFLTNRRQRLNVEFNATGLTLMPKSVDWKMPLYTTPHTQQSCSQRQCNVKPLTDEQIDELSRTMVKGNKSVNWLCRAIEAAHGIKGDA